MQRAGVLAQMLAPGPLPLAPAWADGGWPHDGPCNALSPEGSRCDRLLNLATWQQSDDLDALPGASTVDAAANSATTGGATDAATHAATDVPRSIPQNLQPQPPAALLRQPQPQPDDSSLAMAEAIGSSASTAASSIQPSDDVQVATWGTPELDRGDEEGCELEFVDPEAEAALWRWRLLLLAVTGTWGANFAAMKLASDALGSAPESVTLLLAAYPLLRRP